MLEGNDKAKVQRIVSEIINGKFDDISIDALLFELRDYSQKESLFREIAHFIAHPEREKGEFRDFILNYSKKIKFVWDYRFRGKKLDINTVLPLYVLDLLYNEIKIIDDLIFQNKYNITKQQLLKFIKRNIVKDELHETVNFKYQLPFDKIQVITFCLSHIGEQKEILNEDIIINDIIKTLKENRISFDEKKFKLQSDKIMLCILLLLHLKTLKIEESDEEIPYCSILYNNETELKNIHLGLYGIMNSPEGDYMKIAFPLISTNLLLTQWCDEELIYDTIQSNKKNEITRQLEFNNFKLTYSEKSKKNIKNAIIFVFKNDTEGKLKMEIIIIKDSAFHKTI
jgi:hypothetical protein